MLLCMPSRHHPHTMHGLSALIHLVHFPLSVNSNICSRSSYNLNLIQVCAFMHAKWALSSQSHMQIRCSHLLLRPAQARVGAGHGGTPLGTTGSVAHMSAGAGQR